MQPGPTTVYAAGPVPFTRALEALRNLPPGAVYETTFAEVPLDEVLLSLHESRFTGVVEVGDEPELDRSYLRDGAVVGVAPHEEAARALLTEVVSEQKKLAPELLERAGGARHVGASLGQHLVAQRLVEPSDLERALAELGRRRLFHLYERTGARVVVREGLARLDGFPPAYVDLRPVIAFGAVVCASAERKRAVVRDAFGRRVRLLVPYDERRNSYGLPPPVLHALRLLYGEGVVFGDEPCLPGLTRETTAGLLLLLRRMSLLSFEVVPPVRARGVLAN